MNVNFVSNVPRFAEYIVHGQGIRSLLTRHVEFEACKRFTCEGGVFIVGKPWTVFSLGIHLMGNPQVPQAFLARFFFQFFYDIWWVPLLCTQPVFPRNSHIRSHKEKVTHCESHIKPSHLGSICKIVHFHVLWHVAEGASGNIYVVCEAKEEN
jgi:hypothetical protein